MANRLYLERTMNTQAIIDQLCQLYMLEDEGKNVQKQIDELEEELFETCGEQDNKMVEKEVD